MKPTFFTLILPPNAMQSAILLFLALMSTCTEAQSKRDYRCKIERIETAAAPPNLSLDFQTKNYLGREFAVDRRTGIMSGALKNSYITKPEVIDTGSHESSFKAVTTLRKEQGLGSRTNVYFLVVNEYYKEPRKPFVFAENDTVYFGTCIHF